MPSYEFGWIASGVITIEADNEVQAHAEAESAVKDAHGLAGISPSLEFIRKVEER